MKIAGVFLVVVCCVSSAVLAGTYSGGTGELNNPYQIADVNDLLELGATTTDYNKSFILTADIDLAGQTFTQAPIAPDTSASYGFQGITFAGKFDGNNHTLAHFTINAGGNDYLGLFGLINNASEIKNLGFDACTIIGGTGAEFTGSLVGFNYGTISNCHATVFISGFSRIGGLVGYNNNGKISDCYTTATIDGAGSIGGLAGETDHGSISRCYSIATVSGTQNNLGGLVGYSNVTSISYCHSAGSVSGGYHIGGLVGSNYTGASIDHCYSTATITGNSGSNWVGGLVGSNQYTGSISNSYSTGSVTGYWYVGGLTGQSRFGNITNCYATGPVSGLAGCRYVAGLAAYLETGSITNCYAAGRIAVLSGALYVGGLAGYNSNSCVIAGCFWDTQASGQTTSAGGTGKTIAEMKTLSTFTSAGWDFVNVWGIIETQTYPYMHIQRSADLNYDGLVDLDDFAIFAAQWLQGI